MAEFHHPLLDVREVRKRAIILIGADKGLCGALIHKPCPKSQGRASAASSKFVKSQ